ncbi:hypothetical protein ACQ856_18320 [Mycolicibacterium psychrotolerans]|uniref:hypothetical protein n=1 Tax=Mycolicibacterium psychrotolerans TaxID=216929 RepID=UPI003D67EAB3
MNEATVGDRIAYRLAGITRTGTITATNGNTLDVRDTANHATVNITRGMIRNYSARPNERRYDTETGEPAHNRNACGYEAGCTGCTPTP